MVRFKNRWLLVEIILPSSLPNDPPSSLLPVPPTSIPAHTVSSLKSPPRTNETRHRKRRKTSSSFLHPSNASSSSDSDSEPLTSISPTLLFLPQSPPPPSLTEKNFYLSLKQTIIALHGDSGWASCAGSLNVKYLSTKTCLAIVRCSRDAINVVRTGVAVLGGVGDLRAMANVLWVGGTIKKTQLQAIRYNREVVAAVVGSFSTESSMAEKSASKKAEWDSFLAESEKDIEALVD